MEHAFTLRRSCATVMLATAAFSGGPANADLIVLGSDYFRTVDPTRFLFPPFGLVPLTGVPSFFSGSDTHVRRLGDCSIDLGTVGSTCTIPIELVGLSLVGGGALIRESPTATSPGSMTLTSDGSGTGGTFASFFDVFFDLSLDNGNTFTPAPNPKPLASSGSPWTIVPSGPLLAGLVGDIDANFHSDKGISCPSLPLPCHDFFVGAAPITHTNPDGSIHTVQRLTQVIPEPSVVGLVGVALLGLAMARRRRGG